MQIGLRASKDGTTFEPTIKLSGNISTGIQFDFVTWEKIKEYMKHIGDYSPLLGNQGRAGARPYLRCDYHLYHGVWGKGDHGD
ncbi:hypothetical protein EAI_04731 [Harpegnathos saltator]|uniref:Uncharacterized protein n=1 Tax=Harpegnathos saltator TaxID=610380 RepID=E2BPB1_HARSA|nr:hypothetical protein EAI_04731 [Harpegnathos saltator]